MKKIKYYIYKISIDKLNIISILIFLLLLFLMFFIKSEFVINAFINLFGLNKLFLTLILIILYLYLHELIKLSIFKFMKIKNNNLYTGIELEKGKIYTICNKEININELKPLFIIPYIIVGLLPFVIGIIFEIEYLFLLPLIVISSCVSDLIVAFNLNRIKDDNTKYVDLNENICFAIKSEIKLNEYNLFMFDFKESKYNINKKSMKHFHISTYTIIIFIIFILAHILINSAL